MDKKKYELTVVLPSKTTEKQAKSMVAGLLKKSGGAVISEDFWGSKDLAYNIKKQGRGVFYHLVVELTPKQVSELNKRLNLDEDLLRYLLVIETHAKKGK